MDLQEIISGLTTEEKAALVSGTDFMYTNEIPRYHIVKDIGVIQSILPIKR